MALASRFSGGLFLLALLGFTSLSHAYSVEIRPLGPSEADQIAMTRELMESPEVRNVLGGKSYRVLSSDSERAKVVVYDYTRDLVVRVTRAGGRTRVETEPVVEGAIGWASAPLPTSEEFHAAVEILRDDSVLGADVREGKLIPYRAMPPLLEPVRGGGRRVLPVGLHATADRPHEIVAVDLSRARVERFSRRSPPGSIATASVCGPPTAGQDNPRRGTPGTVEITVRDGEVVVWRMTAIRPAASSGSYGSGLELRDVYHRGRLILRRAHAPILNVDYTSNRCGPFRDPVNTEDAFSATGTAITSGFVRTSQPPKTIFESGVDRGNFWGVAVHEENSRLTLVSELSAGWYRYASEFKFHPDGTIEPFFKFSAVHNSCTCEAHVHHVYWRFDFDLGGATPNGAEVLENEQWIPVGVERNFKRDRSKAWRFTNPSARLAYELRPGPWDGIANAYGVADAWLVKSKPNEIDDSSVSGGRTEARLNAFLNGEALAREDIVFWYGGHVPHTQGTEDLPYIAGPVIKPVEMP